MADGGRIIAAGLVTGFILALAFSQALSGLLFGVSSADPMTFAIVIIVLGVVAGAATCLPARRAIRIDPIDALRGE
jgi:ABC-type antimicrobial peptide transport system permease subunit